ncbi:MAG: hypothetical protein WBB74_04930 [Gaiellaceae bacterium]
MPGHARRARLLAWLVPLVLLAPFTDAARADGDPASDVLYTQWIFLPSDAGIPSAQQTQLRALVEEARRAGFPIKVAVVASAYDLGAVPELWRKPQGYARFLGAELTLYYHYRGRLLIVMPNGLGFYDGKLPVKAELAALRRVSVAAGGRGLATAALTAVRRLAARSGHPLALPNPAKAAPTRTSHTVTWIAFGLGAAVIAGAWAVSLRLRPPRLRRPRTSSDSSSGTK